MEHLKAAALERSKGPIVCERSPVDREKAPVGGANEAVAFEHAKANAEQANVPDQPEANKATVEHAPIEDNSKNRQGLSLLPLPEPVARSRPVLKIPGRRATASRACLVSKRRASGPARRAGAIL